MFQGKGGNYFLAKISQVETFFSTVSTAIDSQSVEKPSNDSVAAAANILDVTEHIGRTMASTLGKWCCNLIFSDKVSSIK